MVGVESDELEVGPNDVVGRAGAFGFWLKHAQVEDEAFGIQSNASKFESDEAGVGLKQFSFASKPQFSRPEWKAVSARASRAARGRRCRAPGRERRPSPKMHSCRE